MNDEAKFILLEADPHTLTSNQRMRALAILGREMRGDDVRRLALQSRCEALFKAELEALRAMKG